jgi:hypothetical protein
MKNRFYNELKCVFNKFPKYQMKSLLRDCNAKVGREDIFKPTIQNESLHEISNDNGVRAVNFATSKNLTVKSMMFPHCNTHKFTWISPDGKMHNHTDHILIDRSWHSSVHDVQLFRIADCDTDHYLVVPKVRERLAVNKQTTHMFICRGSISDRFAAMQNLDTEVDINRAWENIRENIKIQPKRVYVIMN